MHQNTSIMDSQGGNQAQGGQSKSELVDDQSVATKNENTTREKYEHMKQVFRFLINEAPYLIDDKAYERAMDAEPKESLKIKIDSVRKSLGIEDMADVELLVDVMYKYQGEHEARLEEEKKEMEREEQEELENGGNPDAVPKEPAANKAANDGALNGNAE